MALQKWGTHTVRTCDTAGCAAPHKAKGLCQKHYNATPERRVTHALSTARYRATPEGKAVQAAYSARWRATDAGRAMDAAAADRRRESTEGKATRAASTARYLETAQGRAWTERKWARVSLKRAIKAGAVIGDVPPDTRAILRARFGETCLVDGCDNPATDIDHVVALADGGIHDISNLQTLCGACNQSKGKSSADHRPKEGN